MSSGVEIKLRNGNNRGLFHQAPRAMSSAENSSRIVVSVLTMAMPKFLL